MITPVICIALIIFIMADIIMVGTTGMDIIIMENIDTAMVNTIGMDIGIMMSDAKKMLGS